MSKLYAGAGREEIHFPKDIFPFKEGPDTWSGVHDAPCVRVLLFENTIRFGFISIETVIIEQQLADEIRGLVSRISGIPGANLWISATHTVSMPHLFERDHEGEKEDNLAYRMKRRIVAAAADAAKTAAEGMRPVRFGYGEGYCTVNTNRMIPTKGGWWTGFGEEFPSDHSVPVIRLDDENGDPFIILYNYACELSVMDGSVMRDGGRHLTADLAGAASDMIEKAYGYEVTAVFLPGPSSDQGPVYRTRRIMRGPEGIYRAEDIRDDGWLLLELAAERLASQVLVTAGKINCTMEDAVTGFRCGSFTFPGQKLRGLPNPLHAPQKDWVSQPDADRTRGVEIFTVNDIALISVGGLSAATAMKLKEGSPYAHTIIVEHVSGRLKPLPTDGAKGMADAESYDLGTIHARNSEFAKGSAEMMVENIFKMLKK